MFQKRVLPVMVALAASGAMTTHAQQELLEEIVVQGVRSAELNAREMERQKNIFSSVISQDDAGNFADQNVAEALQRLPGITLTKSDGQGEFVNLRGLGPNFVGVSLNNSEMASASGDGRAVGLNTIPADLMGSIEVFKSLTPDMDLNSIAGRVNVNSVTAFDRGQDSLRLTVQGAMHEQRGEFSPKATLIGTKLLADETVGLALSISHEERGTEVNQVMNEGGLRFIRPARPGMGTSFQNNDLSTRDFANNYFYNFESEDELGVDPWMDVPRMLAPNNFEVRQDESVRTRTAATFDFGWRPTTASEYYFRISHTNYTDEELTTRERFDFAAGGLDYVAFVSDDFEPNPEFGWPLDNIFVVGNADLIHRIAIEKSTDKNTTFTLGGENVFNETWTLDYEYHNSSGERTNPNDRRIQFRSRNLPMSGQLSKEDIFARVIDANTLRGAAIAAGTPLNAQNPLSPLVPGATGFTGTFPYLLDSDGRGERYQPNMRYDNLYIENGLRTDDLEQFQVNLRKDFDGERVNYVKAGVLLKERERFRDRSIYNLNPQGFSGFCDGDADCIAWSNTRLAVGRLVDPSDPNNFSRERFATFTPRNPRFDHDMITVRDAEDIISATRVIPEALDPLSSGAASNSQNYSVYENSDEAYLMAEFQVSDTAILIAGARYVKTEFGSTGYLSLRHDRFLEQDTFVRDIVIPLNDPDGGEFVTNSYSGVYPGLHLRWDMNDELLFRTSLWTSFTRPSFGQASAQAEFSNRVKLCRETPLNQGTANERDRCSDNLVSDLGVGTTTGMGASGYVSRISNELSLAPGGNALRLGNTDLTAMEAINFDVSLSWYGDNGQTAEVAMFYKDISDYIVDVRGLSISRDALPRNVRDAIDRIDSTGSTGPVADDFTVNVFKIDEDFIFHNVNTTINGNKATVYGMELSYGQFFDSGLFVTSNMTLLNSKADAGETVRAEKTQMPDQANVTANLTVGWENEYFSARLIGNYRSKVLRQIGTCSQADIDRDALWADLNNADSPNALDGAVGDGTVFAEYCQRWADVFHDATVNLDVKFTYNLSPEIKFYFDIMNVTEDVDVFYYRGNEQSSGNVLYMSEGLGRTYQAGVNVRFW